MSDYRLAFSLISAPSVAIIVALGALMHMGNSVQTSFYVAWLTDMGIAGTAIGLLSPAGAIGAALFSLLTAPLMRYVSGFWIVLLSCGPAFFSSASRRCSAPISCCRSRCSCARA